MTEFRLINLPFFFDTGNDEIGNPVRESADFAYVALDVTRRHDKSMKF